jgi:sec-independent protein translocase protein TatB
MFDVGFTEIFLLALIGLLVLGPERLPGVARTVGGFVRKARASWVSLRNTIETELAEADIAAPIKKTSDELKKIGKDLADMQGFDLDKRKSETIKPIAESTDIIPEAGPSQESDSGKA